MKDVQDIETGCPQVFACHKHMKKTLTNLVAGAIIGAGTLFGSAQKAQALYVNFDQIARAYNSGSSSKAIHSNRSSDWSYVENLRYRTDPNDPSGNSDIVVPKSGYRDSTTGNWIGEIWDV